MSELTLHLLLTTAVQFCAMLGLDARCTAGVQVLAMVGSQYVMSLSETSFGSMVWGGLEYPLRMSAVDGDCPQHAVARSVAATQPTLAQSARVSNRRPNGLAGSAENCALRDSAQRSLSWSAGHELRPLLRMYTNTCLQPVLCPSCPPNRMLCMYKSNHLFGCLHACLWY